jgi:hypothetical protein
MPPWICRLDQCVQRITEFGRLLFVKKEADIFHLSAGLNVFNFHASDVARQLGKSALISAIVRLSVDPRVHADSRAGMAD